jgi:septal ring factor EnvC (AmiA/AmiB activator)
VRSSSLVLLLAAGLLLASPIAWPQEDRAQQVLARAQGLLRQVSAQKQELEAANGRLTAEVESLKRQLAKSEASLQESAALLAAERKRAERGVVVEERLDQTRATLQEARDRLRTAGDEARRRDQELAEADARLAVLERGLAEAERNNLEMYQLNVQILDLYRNKSPWKSLVKADPITGLATVEVENTLQEYRVKLEDVRVEPTPEPTPENRNAGSSN